MSQPCTQPTKHETVLRQEAVAALALRADGRYVDATYGRGGHSRGILQGLGPRGRLLALDRDPEAIADARVLAAEDGRLCPVHAKFSDLGREVQRCFSADARADADSSGKVHGILFDFGMSSPQLDNPQRGFSFMQDGPLDMRMDASQGETAADWIDRASETEIAHVLFHYGEERNARRLARRLVAARQEAAISDTGRLAALISDAKPAIRRSKKPAHPATRAFQAIRIHINDELEEIRRGLEQALEALESGGRLVAIAFHSLEDRIVKRFIAAGMKGDAYPRHLPVPQSMLQPKLRRIGRAQRPSAAEIECNPRARSAVMRVAEKI